VDESLRTLIKGIGDYLTRVVGSVPIGLNITLRFYGHRIHPIASVTYGPLYYEGQGQAISDSSEEVKLGSLSALPTRSLEIHLPMLLAAYNHHLCSCDSAHLVPLTNFDRRRNPEHLVYLPAY
jgi:hypothetical protein